MLKITLKTCEGEIMKYGENKLLDRIQDKWFLCKECQSPTESITVYAETKDGRGFIWKDAYRACLNCNLLFREYSIKSFPLNRLGLIRLERIGLSPIKI